MANIQSIEPNQLKQWLDNNEAVVVDVREPAEYKGGHIPAAVNKPLSKIDVKNVNMPEHKNKKLVLQCQSGKRSMMAADKLLKESPDFDIWNLEGGIAAWQNEGFSIEKTGKAIMPVDRQMQTIAGTLIITGVVFSAFVSPLWLLLLLFVGLGLLIAGITGWCGMMKFLATMPWNKA